MPTTTIPAYTMPHMQYDRLLQQQLSLLVFK